MDRLSANRYGLLHEPGVRQLQLLESAWTVRGLSFPHLLRYSFQGLQFRHFIRLVWKGVLCFESTEPREPLATRAVISDAVEQIW